jgi:exodeoxyribonuclease VII large subunit
MKKVAMNRWPLVELILIPTLVQGEEAKYDIVSSLTYANTLAVDLIIVGRGGGSIEDLWAFNEEIVAIAIYKSIKPVISAVGHEVDFLISDFVADLRSATPSNAMEMALPDINEYRMYIDNLSKDFENRFKNIYVHKQNEVNNMFKLFEQNSIESKFNFITEQINMIRHSYKNYLIQVLNTNQNRLNNLKENFEVNNPIRKDKNGYAQISLNNKIINLEDLTLNDKITLQSPKTIVSCLVESIEEQY